MEIGIGVPIATPAGVETVAKQSFTDAADPGTLGAAIPAAIVCNEKWEAKSETSDAAGSTQVASAV